MGNRRDRDWIELVALRHAGQRVLEVGAAHRDARHIRQAVEKAGCTYIGVDMREHFNADLVHNMNEPLHIDPVGMVICLSVLEHCDKPWLVAKHIEDVLEPGGRLMLSVPFSWRVHNYPSDYWRFTPEGIRLLFPRMEWKELQPVPPMRLDEHVGGKVEIYAQGIRKSEE